MFMDAAAAEDRKARAERMLARAGEIMLCAMESLQDAIACAEAAADKRDLSLALARVNRGLRQTLLLEERLERGARQAERQAGEDRAAAAKLTTEARAAALKVRARSRVLEACESREAAEDLLDDISYWARDYAQAAEVTGQPIDELVLALCRDLGLAFEPDDPPPALRPQAPDPTPTLVQRPDLGWSAPDSS